MTTARQFRYTLAAGATAVVIGVGFTVVGFNRDGSGSADRASVNTPLSARPTIDLDTGTGPDLLLDDTAASTPPSTPASSPAPVSPSTPATKKPTPKASRSPSKKATPKPTPSKTKTTAAAAEAPATSGSVLDQVLAHINAARTAEGLPAYTLDADLSKASALHNQLMIDGCGLSHQCSGEGGIGDRFSAQGVKWSSAGENIGYSSAGSSDAAQIKAANGTTDSMLAEVPPEDGHRKNLLSDGFKRIGLSVIRDDNGLVWVTQDFVG